MQELWKLMQKAYVDLGISKRYAIFKLSMIQKKGGAPPKLRGKGSEIKALIPIVLNLWERFYNKNITVHRQVLAMLRLNCKLERLMDEHRLQDSFPHTAAADFKATAGAMCHLQCLLFDHFAASGDEGVPRLFIITAKNHCLQHICSQAGAINPRKTWCFAGEDYMHVAKVLCQNCTFGVKPIAAPAKMVEHYRLGMHYQCDM